jgi:NAD(P)-dependent dehydrogenase (short-subunit alcohol dehydrogenase family)
MSKVVLITGTSSGIGRASALMFAQKGFVTYATARRLDAIRDLERAGCRILSLDVTDEASMQATVATIEAEQGGVDILVNNAGYGVPGAVEEVEIAAWRQQFEINVFGLVRLTQLVLPGMRKRKGGKIINISSGGGEMTFPLAGSYHATKYAVESLSDALRFEVAPFGIDVVVIQPGGVKTPLAEKTASGIESKPNSPYANMINTVGKTMREGYESGNGVLTPEAVAQVILQAAQASRPKTRYKIGMTANLMPCLRRFLPDRAWDRLLKRMLGSNQVATMSTTSPVQNGS